MPTINPKNAYVDPAHTLEKLVRDALIRADSSSIRVAPMVAWYLQAAQDVLNGELESAEQSARLAKGAL